MNRKQNDKKINDELKNYFKDYRDKQIRNKEDKKKKNNYYYNKEEKKQYYIQNLDKFKQYYKQNRVKIIEYNKTRNRNIKTNHIRDNNINRDEPTFSLML